MTNGWRVIPNTGARCTTNTTMARVCIIPAGAGQFPNMRPDYRCEFVRGARHFGADLYLVHWLEQEGIEFDVITDHDLDSRRPEAALSGTGVLITGTHPEYVSESIRRGHRPATSPAVAAPCTSVANGFYWVCETTAAARMRWKCVAVTRVCRAWESAAGETTMLKRPTGRTLAAPQADHRSTFFGAGFVAQGWDDDAVGYAVHDDPPAFDRADRGCAAGASVSADSTSAAPQAMNSTPPTRRTAGRAASSIATSTGHSDYYHPSCEWIHRTRTRSFGPLESGDSRGDRHHHGRTSSFVRFAVGSIAWASCLSHNGYDNGVATLTRNAVALLLATSAELV